MEINKSKEKAIKLCKSTYKYSLKQLASPVAKYDKEIGMQAFKKLVPVLYKNVKIATTKLAVVVTLKLKSLSPKPAWSGVREKRVLRSCRWHHTPLAKPKPNALVGYQPVFVIFGL
jgi:hypothetical protein